MQQATIKHGFRMDELPLLKFSNYTLIGYNLVLGMATMEAINLAVAASGAFVTVLANLDRVAYSLVRIAELARNGWRIPAPPPAESDNTEPDNDNPPNDTQA